MMGNEVEQERVSGKRRAHVALHEEEGGKREHTFSEANAHT
jgi:hypothetical protein